MLTGSWKELSRQLEQEYRAAMKPINAGLELTPLCNFNCSMCYVHLKGDRVKERGGLHTAKEWIELGRKLADASVLTVTFTGGEVFSRPDFREIYEAYCRMGFLITIYSNGYLINEDTIDWLSKMPPQKIRVTVYGASDDTYRAVCGVNDGFTVVDRNIRRMLDKGMRVGAAMTVIRDNEQDLYRVLDYCKNLGIHIEATRGVVKPLPGVDSRASEVRCESHPIIELSEVKRQPMLFDRDPDKPFSVCRSYRVSLWITWDGRMQLCPTLYQIQEPVFEKDFPECWRSMNERLSKLTSPGKCRDCKYIGFCLSCPGDSAVENGDPEKRSEKDCRIAYEMYRTYSSDFDPEEDEEGGRNV